jgi:prephenate dehydrogenase
MTSHVPHFLAFALCLAAIKKDRNSVMLTGKGFKDTTRIAASNPDLWSEIAFANKKHVNKGLDILVKYIREIRRNTGNPRKLRVLLGRAKKLREALP